MTTPRGKVTHIRKSQDGSRVERIKVVNITPTEFAREDAVRHLAKKEMTLWVLARNGIDQSEVRPVEARDKVKHLRTDPDLTKADNLLSLPLF